MQSFNNRQFLYAVLGTAIFIRLLLMPFFSHVDLYSEMRRVFFVYENSYWLDNSHRFVVFYIELFFAAVASVFIDITPGLFHLEDPKASVASITEYSFFLNDPNLYRHLFFFKLPYLLFDIATAMVIWRFVDDPNNRRLALVFWLFNPLTLFATYIFGRFEVISLFFLAYTALKLKQHQIVMASLGFAAALLSREINLLFLPFFILATVDFKDGILQQLFRGLSLSLLVIVIYLIPDTLLTALGGNTDLFVPHSGRHEVDALNKLLSLGYYWFYPIIICLSLLAIYAWEIRHSNHEEWYVIACGVALLVYFGFNVHSIHYASWLMLLPIMSIQLGRQITLPLIVLSIAWIVLWLLKTDAGVFTLFLASPINPELAHYGHFPSFYQEHFAGSGVDLHQAIQIMRSIFLVAMIFCAYRMLINRKHDAN